MMGWQKKAKPVARRKDKPRGVMDFFSSKHFLVFVELWDGFGDSMMTTLAVSETTLLIIEVR